MSSFLKKAISLFVEIEETPDTSKASNTNVVTPQVNQIKTPITTTNSAITNADLEKFVSHFEKLLEQSNMQGPDYYEFCKMLETLEAHIPDEKARYSAVYASLAIQGLTKQKLLETANYYKNIISSDKLNFEKALDNKVNSDLISKKNEVVGLDKKMVDNSALIQKLTQEIAEAQVKIENLKKEIHSEESRLENNKKGYQLASEAVLSKIDSDIQKIQTSI